MKSERHTPYFSFTDLSTFEKMFAIFYRHEFVKLYDSRQYSIRPAGSSLRWLIDFISRKLQDPTVLAYHLCAVDLEKGFGRISHCILFDKMGKDGFYNFFISFYGSTRQPYKPVSSRKMETLSEQPEDYYERHLLSLLFCFWPFFTL